MLLKRDGCELPWSTGGSADVFWTELLKLHPEITPTRPGIRLARNGEFLCDNERIEPGDEVALIPPVSGG
jgi:sulfur carrier protein ThiS